MPSTVDLVFDTNLCPHPPAHPDVSKIANFGGKFTVFRAKKCVFRGIWVFGAPKRRFCGVMAGIFHFLLGIFGILVIDISKICDF